MAIEIANQTRSNINRSLIERAVKKVLKFAKQEGNVSVVIVGDAAMQKLNKLYRSKNKPTDVLSFSEADSQFPDNTFIGEIVIDWLQIKRQAKILKHSAAWELAFIVIHGMLHLIGYEDETKRGALEMERLGNNLIKKITI
ncbi:MAG: rRNA maturation RNase YbeY [Candidatus Falkowbacteria bacterium]|nr:rRNA maturation RNase YbeY [Candidatus Falkowbacteria bacterium]